MADLTRADQIIVASCACLSLQYGAAGGEREMHIQILEEALPRASLKFSPIYSAVVRAAQTVVSNARVKADRNSQANADAMLRIGLARFFEERAGHLREVSA